MIPAKDTETLRTRLREQADYMDPAISVSGVPMKVETDSVVWRESIALFREAADALSAPPQPTLPAWAKLPFHGSMVRPTGPYVLLSDLQSTVVSAPPQRTEETLCADAKGAVD